MSWVENVLGREAPEWLKAFGRMDGEAILRKAEDLGLPPEQLEELRTMLFEDLKDREDVERRYQRAHELLCPLRLRRRIVEYENRRDKVVGTLGKEDPGRYLLRSEVEFVETLTSEERERYLLTKEILVELQRRYFEARPTYLVFRGRYFEAMSRTEFEGERPLRINWRCFVYGDIRLGGKDPKTGEDVRIPFVQFYRRWDGKLFMRRSRPEDHSIVTFIKNKFFPEKEEIGSIDRTQFTISREYVHLKGKVMEEFKEIFDEFGFREDEWKRYVGSHNITWFKGTPSWLKGEA